MQNRGVHFASHLRGFRAHTRVFLTLSVALLVAFVCLSSTPAPAASVFPAPPEKSAPRPALPLEQTRPELPPMAIRFLFLLPHLIPHDH